MLLSLGRPSGRGCRERAGVRKERTTALGGDPPHTPPPGPRRPLGPPSPGRAPQRIDGRRKPPQRASSPLPATVNDDPATPWPLRPPETSPTRVFADSGRRKPLRRASLPNPAARNRSDARLCRIRPPETPPTRVSAESSRRKPLRRASLPILAARDPGAAPKRWVRRPRPHTPRLRPWICRGQAPQRPIQDPDRSWGDLTTGDPDSRSSVVGRQNDRSGI